MLSTVIILLNTMCYISNDELLCIVVMLAISLSFVAFSVKKRDVEVKYYYKKNFFLGRFEQLFSINKLNQI